MFRFLGLDRQQRHRGGEMHALSAALVLRDVQERALDPLRGYGHARGPRGQRR